MGKSSGGIRNSNKIKNKSLSIIVNKYNNDVKKYYNDKLIEYQNEIKKQLKNINLSSIPIDKIKKDLIFFNENKLETIDEYIKRQVNLYKSGNYTIGLLSINSPLAKRVLDSKAEIEAKRNVLIPFYKKQIKNL